MAVVATATATATATVSSAESEMVAMMISMLVVNDNDDGSIQRGSAGEGGHANDQGAVAEGILVEETEERQLEQ